ncbi:MAG TPA: HAMP domain-containing sensor histidine kinase [Actinomycetota bacterium]|nr:HAMP domain-containing sensor histidine kinase [Actinomycetota bacterium]
MRPFEKLPTIRAKLGSVIVVAVALTVVLIFGMLGYALRDSDADRERLQLFRVARRAAAGTLEAPPAEMRIVRYRPDGTLISEPSPWPLPPDMPDAGSYVDWGVRVGQTAEAEFAVVPVVEDGAVSELVFAVRAIPDRTLPAKITATFEFLSRFWWQFLVAGALAAGFALLFARWFARGMTQPLRDMAAAARRMETGTYEVRVEASARDEVGQLAHAFNRMSGELARLEASRRDLVANVSHELKTPIAAMRAHLENLLDGVEEPDRETLEVMLAQAERLGRLVEQLLDLSKLESGEVPLHRDHVPVAPIVRQVVSEIEVARAGKAVRIAQDIPPDLPTVDADAERVHQVLFNLVDNALRFVPEGGEVTIAAHRHNGSVEISVADNGVGIPREHLPRLFERFYRADTARARGDGGTGIGLAIARSVVEAHGGSIRAESEPGSGSVFSFDLPASADASHQPADASG